MKGVFDTGKWVFDPKTGGMRPKKEKGFRVSGRIGGVMVEDFDRHIQFLINYGTDRVTHCVGCTERDLHIFDEWTAKRIAEEIARVSRSHNASTKYSDYRLLCSSCRNVKADTPVVERFGSYTCESLDADMFQRNVAKRAEANLRARLGDRDCMSVCVSATSTAPLVMVSGTEDGMLKSATGERNLTFFTLPDNTKPNVMVGVDASLDLAHTSIDKFSFVRDKELLASVRSMYGMLRSLDELRDVKVIYIQVLY